MSKKQNGILGSSYDPSMSGCIVEQWKIGNLVGKLLTIVESLGLKDTQEKALKDILRNEIHDMFTLCSYISYEDAERIREKNELALKVAPNQSLPAK